jgi:hypothetical protein
MEFLEENNSVGNCFPWNIVHWPLLFSQINLQPKIL